MCHRKDVKENILEKRNARLTSKEQTRFGVTQLLHCLYWVRFILSQGVPIQGSTSTVCGPKMAVQKKPETGQSCAKSLKILRTTSVRIQSLRRSQTHKTWSARLQGSGLR
ncbi:hypothetical protein BaRGS_00013144 [Batillaria attramentaria]|uniref:Uncharacterized protein n=1 Tax=Batillaria attramentaria TaxID=370345 RepID=A0ABD0L8K6_9CAEN